MAEETQRDPVASLPTTTINGKVVEGADGVDLLSLDLQLSTRVPSTLELVFEERVDESDASLAKLDAAIEVKDPASGKVLFSGVVTSVGLQAEGTLIRTVVRATDLSHRLRIAHEFKAHAGAPDALVKAIAKDNGLTPKVKIDDVASIKHVIQLATAAEVLDDLAQRHGCEWYVSAKELHFAPPKLEGSKTTINVKAVDDWSLEISHVGVPTSATASHWDPETAKATPESVKAGAEDAYVPVKASDWRKQIVDAAKKAPELAVAGAPVATEKEAKAIAQGAVRARLADTVTFQADLSDLDLGIEVAEAVKLDGFGKGVDGDLRVTDVRHRYEPDHQSTTIACRPSGRTGTASRGTWGANGPVVAVVDAVNDPDKAGRVRVKFPMEGNAQSEWARVVSVGAGAGKRGIDFRPEVGDEVLVAFEHGDPRFPIVLGGLWNKKKHPAAGEAKGETRTIQSREGHMLQFQDEDKAILLANGKTKNSVTLSEDDGITIEVPSGKELVLKAGASSLTFDGTGNITLKAAGKKIVFDAGNLEQKASIALKAQGTQVELKASATMKIQASAQAEINGGAMTMIKGGMVKLN